MAISSVLLLNSGYGIFGYLFGLVIGNFVSTAGYFFCGKLAHKIRFREQDKTLRKGMLIYSLPIVPNMLSWWLNSSAAKYALLFFVGSAETGLYSVAAKVPAIMNLFTSIFQQAWMYASAKAYESDDKSSFYSSVFSLFSGAITIASSALITFIPYISLVVLKGDFYKAWVYVPSLLLSATLNSYSIFFGELYKAAKENKTLMLSTMIGAAVNVLSCLLLVPMLGIVGAVIANVLCYLTIFVFRLIDSRRYMELGARKIIMLVTMALIVVQTVIPIVFSDHMFPVQILITTIIVLIQSSTLIIMFIKSK